MKLGLCLSVAAWFLGDAVGHATHHEWFDASAAIAMGVTMVFITVKAVSK